MPGASCCTAGVTQRVLLHRRKLLQVNPDNYGYHEALRAALQLPVAADAPLSDNQRSELRRVYADLLSAFPKSAAVRRIPLDFLVSPLSLKRYKKPTRKAEKGTTKGKKEKKQEKQKRIKLQKLREEE